MAFTDAFFPISPLPHPLVDERARYFAQLGLRYTNHTEGTVARQAVEGRYRDHDYRATSTVLLSSTSVEDIYFGDRMRPHFDVQYRGLNRVELRTGPMPSTIVLPQAQYRQWLSYGELPPDDLKHYATNAEQVRLGIQDHTLCPPTGNAVFDRAFLVLTTDHEFARTLLTPELVAYLGNTGMPPLGTGLARVTFAGQSVALYDYTDETAPGAPWTTVDLTAPQYIFPAGDYLLGLLQHLPPALADPEQGWRRPPVTPIPDYRPRIRATDEHVDDQRFERLGLQHLRGKTSAGKEQDILRGTHRGHRLEVIQTRLMTNVLQVRMPSTPVPRSAVYRAADEGTYLPQLSKNGPAVRMPPTGLPEFDRDLVAVSDDPAFFGRLLRPDVLHWLAGAFPLFDQPLLKFDSNLVYLAASSAFDLFTPEYLLPLADFVADLMNRLPGDVIRPAP
jgi:hypothetical protein